MLRGQSYQRCVGWRPATVESENGTPNESATPGIHLPGFADQDVACPCNPQPASQAWPAEGLPLGFQAFSSLWSVTSTAETAAHPRCQ